MGIMDEYSEAVIHAKVFANQFHDLVKNFRPPLRASDARMNHRIAACNERIIDFILRLKNSLDHGRCDVKTFKEQLIKINSSKLLELEIWWYLMKVGVMRKEDFFQIFDSNENEYFTKSFCECLCRYISQERTDLSFRKNVNIDMTDLLLHYKERCDQKEVQCPAYTHFVHFLSLHMKENKQEIVNSNSLADILKMTSVKESVIKSFTLDFIEVLLQGQSLTLQTVMHKNEHFIKNEKAIVEKELKIFHFINLDDFISYIKKIFIKSSKPIHWQNLFYVLSYVKTYFGDHLKEFKALILFLLEDALQNLNKSSLLYVFILARQCSTVPNFPSYLNWFSATFSSESSRPINTMEKAMFFISFLNEIVEFDSPYYLKVHINRVPYLPMDCQFLLSDYVKLAKTKLTDLNESTELGLFDNVSTKSSSEFDVETVLNIFSNTNEVPKCVLEASLFCRLYYEKKFLVTLLSKYEGKNSVRHKFITKLQALGKIPNSLFLNYKHHM